MTNNWEQLSSTAWHCEDAVQVFQNPSPSAGRSMTIGQIPPLQINHSAAWICMLVFTCKQWMVINRNVVNLKFSDTLWLCTPAYIFLYTFIIIYLINEGWSFNDIAYLLFLTLCYLWSVVSKTLVLEIQSLNSCSVKKKTALGLLRCKLTNRNFWQMVIFLKSK